ncbi:PREDICTED: uncharacterized protein LOC105562190 [Vollenhovia emeryi]|uniref:uncharacterized protein LOC105562190 n=1 Tax=Vollenhovia emeryi TaxID=411798 RepID=UPI0005F4F217|nr:PREDICTED: uncharacterized protein LOC105562190 [Vollenhovia emeryi]
MCRRLPLTSAAFKYIDIGIRVVPRASYVEIILGDNQGHQMELDQSIWKEYRKNPSKIDQLLKATDAASSSAVQLNHLALELVRTRHGNIVKVTSNNTSMYMKPSTISFLFELEHCVDRIYFHVYDDLETVHEIFEELVVRLQDIWMSGEKKCDSPNDAVRILHDMYYKNSIENCEFISIIKCELMAYAVKEILGEAKSRGDVF